MRLTGNRMRMEAEAIEKATKLPAKTDKPQKPMIYPKGKTRRLGKRTQKRTKPVEALPDGNIKP